MFFMLNLKMKKMKKTILLPVYAACVLLFASCQEAAKQETPAPAATVTETPKPDLVQLKTEIQAVENAWAEAQTKKDIKAMMALYADGAMSMQDGGPTLVGKADIQKQQEADFAGPRKYASIAFETSEVYAEGDYVTELGITKYLDAAGKATSTGKYMVVFVKKDGKYLCLREIFNKDAK